MAKKINKVERYLVSVNAPQKEMLEQMMKEDAQVVASDFFCAILVNEWKNRQLAREKRPVGRPRKEDNDEADAPEQTREEKYADDLPKTILYMGQKIGQREADDIDNLQKQFQPH